MDVNIRNIAMNNINSISHSHTCGEEKILILMILRGALSKNNGQRTERIG